MKSLFSFHFPLAWFSRRHVWPGAGKAPDRRGRGIFFCCSFFCRRAVGGQGVMCQQMGFLVKKRIHYYIPWTLLDFFFSFFVFKRFFFFKPGCFSFKTKDRSFKAFPWPLHLGLPEEQQEILRAQMSEQVGLCWLAWGSLPGGKTVRCPFFLKRDLVVLLGFAFSGDFLFLTFFQGWGWFFRQKSRPALSKQILVP